MKIKWCIICSGIYNDSSIKELIGSTNSTQRLNKVIISELGIPKEDVLYIIDENQQEIINKVIDFWESINEDDTVIFYFCGHGAKVNKQLYLFAHDTRKQYIELTAISYNYIINTLKQQRIKRIIAILDCCNSGAAINMGIEIEEGIKNQILVEGEVTLCSCSEIETSIQKEYEGEFHSVFTYIFTKVLSMGLKNDKEFLSVNDLMLLLKEKYEEESGKTLMMDRKQNLDKLNLFKNMDYVRKEKVEKDFKLDEVRKDILKRKEWKVLLVKCSIDYPTRGIDFGIPLGLWVLKNYITLLMPNVVVDVYDERLFEMQDTTKVFEKEIQNYDIIGISICTCEVPKAIEKFKIAHEMGKITVAGGIFTYSNEEYLLKQGFIDYVISGVGTLPWVELIKALDANKELQNNLINVNHVYSKNNKNTMVWVTDTMPGIELHTWDEILKLYSHFITKKIYVNEKESFVPKIDVVTSRGCNKSCSFCSVRTETGSSVIKRDKRVIQEEIDYLYSRGIRYFSIKDEDFFIHGTSRVEDILEYCKQYEDIKFKIRMRLDTWEKYGDKISLGKLRDWGIDEIQYGVESPQNDILMMLQKGIDIEKHNVINLFKEHYENEIKVNASFILSCSELENEKYYKSLEEFIEKIYSERFLIPYLNFYTPHPTQSKLCIEKYTITTNNYNFYTHKIPVAYPSQMKQPEREVMLKAYDQISEKTKSREYNPTIPESARELFILGKPVFNS